MSAGGPIDVTTSVGKQKKTRLQETHLWDNSLSFAQLFKAKTWLRTNGCLEAQQTGEGFQ